ncbi:type II secretion system protein GspM [Deltaproteobacteria bacterium TL4]
MSELSQRERLLIAVMMGLLIALLVSMIAKKLSGYEASLTQQKQTQEKRLKEVQKLEKEWIGLQNTSTAPIMPGSLSSFVESTARKLQIHNNLQLNAITNAPSGTEGVQVRLDQLNLDQLFETLYTIEKKYPVLLMDQLDVSISPGSRMLRVAFRVYKQKNE